MYFGLRGNGWPSMSGTCAGASGRWVSPANRRGAMHPCLSVPSIPGHQAEAIMPFPIYAAMLSSQLLVTVADRIPEFDAGPFCRTYSAGDSVQSCLASEKQAHEKLIEAWPRYTAHDKSMCVMEEKIAGLPSYVGWLTCLDINANARRVDATKSVGTSPSDAGTSETGPRRRGHRRRAAQP